MKESSFLKKKTGSNKSISINKIDSIEKKKNISGQVGAEVGQIIGTTSYGIVKCIGINKKMPFFCLQPGDMVAIGANQYIGLVIGSDFTIIFIWVFGNHLNVVWKDKIFKFTSDVLIEKKLLSVYDILQKGITKANLKESIISSEHIWFFVEAYLIFKKENYSLPYNRHRLFITRRGSGIKKFVYIHSIKRNFKLLPTVESRWWHNYLPKRTVKTYFKAGYKISFSPSEAGWSTKKYVALVTKVNNYEHRIVEVALRPPIKKKESEIFTYLVVELKPEHLGFRKILYISVIRVFPDILKNGKILIVIPEVGFYFKKKVFMLKDVIEGIDVSSKRRDKIIVPIDLDAIIGAKVYNKKYVFNLLRQH